LRKKEEFDIDCWLNLDTIDGVEIAYILSQGSIKEKLLNKGNILFFNGNYEVALKCFVLCKLSFDLWKKYLEHLYSKQEKTWILNYLVILQTQMRASINCTLFVNKIRSISTNLSAISENTASTNSQFLEKDITNALISKNVLKSMPKIGYNLTISNEQSRVHFSGFYSLSLSEDITVGEPPKVNVISRKFLNKTVGEPPPDTTVISLKFDVMSVGEPPPDTTVIPLKSDVMSVGEPPPDTTVISLKFDVMSVGEPPPDTTGIPLKSDVMSVGEPPPDTTVISLKSDVMSVGEPPPHLKIISLKSDVITVGEPPPHLKIVSLKSDVITVGEPPPYLKIISLKAGVITVGEPPPHLKIISLKADVMTVKPTFSHKCYLT
jgi:hypothetical protein